MGVHVAERAEIGPSGPGSDAARPGVPVAALAGGAVAGLLGAAGTVLHLWDQGADQRGWAGGLLASAVLAGTALGPLVAGRDADGGPRGWAGRSVVPVLGVLLAVVVAAGTDVGSVGGASLLVTAGLVAAGLVLVHHARRTAVPAGGAVLVVPAALGWWVSGWWPSAVALVAVTALLPAAWAVAAGDAVGAAASALRRATGSAGRTATSGGRALAGRVPHPRSLAAWVAAPARSAVLAWSAVGAVLAAPIYQRLGLSSATRVQGMNDLATHIRIAETVRWEPPWVASPLPLYPILAKLAGAVLGQPSGSTLVLAVALGATVGVVVRLGRELIPTGPAAWVVAAPHVLAGAYLFGESPSATLERVELCCGRGPVYIPLHQWGNPTGALVLPFAAAAALYAVRGLRDLDDRAASRGLTVTLALGLLAKPSFALAFLPALALEVVLVHGWGRPAIRWLLRVAALPAAILAVQAVRMRQIGALPDGTEYGLELAPFAFLSRLGAGRWDFWLLLWPVVLGAIVGRRRFLAAPGVRLTLVSTLVGGVTMALFRDTAGISGGDVAWGFLVSVRVLYVVAVAHLLQEVVAARADRGRSPAWAPLAAGLLVLSVVSGVVALLGAYGVIGPRVEAPF